MTELLPEGQATHAHEIAEQEVRRFARLLADEIAATPARADGNINGRDLWEAFNESIKRYDRGDVA